MDKVLHSVVNDWIDSGTIKESDAEIYYFGLQEGIILFFNILLTLLVAVLVSDLKTGVLFLLYFIPVRCYSGGFHAKTRKKCLVVSLVLIAAALKGAAFAAYIEKELLSLLIFVSTGLIVWLSPIESANKPLSKKEIKQYKKNVIWILCIEDSLAVLSLLWFAGKGVPIILMAQLTALVLDIGGKIQ